VRVLIVEDDSSVAQSLELMLKSEGFNPYSTDLGHEAVELAKIYDYDVVLLDLNLPDTSGYDVLRSLRVGKVKTPVLILSFRHGFALGRRWLVLGGVTINEIADRERCTKRLGSG
jgi:DNA-binding response OmpR family regulator